VTPPVAITIAGTDSGGGAGIAADLKTFAAHGVFGTFAVTAVTAQNTASVDAVRVMEPSLVEAQIRSVSSDLAPRGAKTGMLATPEIVALVTQMAAEGRLPPLVVDPVLVASSGDPLFEGSGTEEAYRALAATATVLTPNMPEASLLVGRPVESVEQMEEAAREMRALGAGLVVVKGGHLRSRSALDVVFDGKAMSHLESPFVESRNVHGTGCSFAAAVAANIALGRDPMAAVLAAKRYVHRAILLAASWRLGRGHGPIDHFGAAPCRKEEEEESYPAAIRSGAP
jgi:hydroxymethylpyrimidine/phosphomethylpyrimidine kinase